MNYTEFLETKKKRVTESGFTVLYDDINKSLFDFQKEITIRALAKGKYAIFADTGLGKTIMQLEWAHHVSKYTNQPVLILAPLAVSGQTIREGEKFNIHVEKLKSDVFGYGIYITNYEQIENIVHEQFSGIVLDESSILKNFTGEYKRKIINYFEKTRYKLACSATPSPNDLNEIGNHSEFLNIMMAKDMRMRWFIRDEGMNNYRLKGHAEKDFYGWISSWSIFINKPSDIGNYNDNGYILPKITYIEHQIVTPKEDNYRLFNDSSVNAINFNHELRRNKEQRMNKVAEITNRSIGQVIIWVKLNEEADYLKKIIPDAIEVRGNEDPGIKEDKLLGFADNKFRVLITKTKIAQFGLNYQNCNIQIFASLDFSFESLYQATRRSYRFGQKNNVDIHLVTLDTMENVLGIITKKSEQFDKLVNSTIKYTNKKKYTMKLDYNYRKEEGENYIMYQGDCVDIIQEIADQSIDLSIFSPPFSTLFTYSDNIRDMGNCADDAEFYKHYKYLLTDLYRIIKQGRLVAIHTKDLAVYKNSDGYTGLYNFTGIMHNLMEDAGFKYHSKITIWTDPVLEMQRTKTQRLLYKQVTSNSGYSGIGLPEYVTIFKKWEGNEEDWTPINFLNKNNFSLDLWQRWASPVWMDIRRTDVLNDWRGARTEKDEKHICPLQLGVIERLIALYSNEGETIFTPFMGIGSEIYKAIEMKRKGIGIELKESYFDNAVKNIKNMVLKSNQLTLV